MNFMDSLPALMPAALLVGGIGLISGLMLALASIAMAVPVDEKAQIIEAALPHANCGACGFTGCADYATAISQGKTQKLTLCAPGGAAVAAKLAAIMGVQAVAVERMAATVCCSGKDNAAKRLYSYSGSKTCAEASQLFGGPKLCNFGCLGFGDCVNVCEYKAISLIDGIAVVDDNLCRACNKCVQTCPKGIIRLMPALSNKAVVLCMNTESGAVTRKECSIGCIGCGLCVKNCPSGAISLENNLAHVDHEKCVACGKCMEVCPTKAMHTICRASAYTVGS